MPSRPIEKYDDDEFDFSPSDQFISLSISASSTSAARARKSSDDHFHANTSSSSRKTMASPSGTIKSGSSKGSIRLKTLNDLARLREEDEDDFASGFEITEGSLSMSSPLKLPKGRMQSGTSTASRSTIRNFQMEVAGQSGIGTITRYTSKKNSEEQDKAKKAQEENESWDADFGGEGMGPGGKLSLSTQLKAKQAKMAKQGPDISTPMDGFDDDDEATLKASSTIKAKLPSPARKFNTIRSLRDNPVIAPPKIEEEDMEDGLIIPTQGLRLVPLNKDNLAEMNKQHAANIGHRPRSRKPADECISSITSSSISRAGKHAFWSDGNDSPKGRSDTSATSFTSISTPKDGPSYDVSQRNSDDLGDDLDGLVFPSKPFTASHALRRLKQRKAANYANYVDRVRGDGDQNGKRVADEMDDTSEEHGLVFADFRPSERELDRLARKREREAEDRKSSKVSVGQHPPAVALAEQARTQSPSGRLTPGGSLRSQSASITTPKSKVASARPRTSLDNQYSSHQPMTPKSLRRHQSTADFALSTGSALKSKVSMPNIKENAEHSPPSSFAQQSYHATTRVLNPTAASSAKAKSKVRPPLPSSFTSRHARDDHADSSSMSSVSTAASARPEVKEYKYGSAGRSTGKSSGGKKGGTGGHKSLRTIEWTVPKMQRPLTDPTALDDIPDLDADDGASPKNSLRVKSRLTEPTISSMARAVKAHDEGDAYTRREKKRGPQLIKWNGAPVKKQIGNSTFDPRTMRWLAPDDEETMAYFNRFEPSVPAGPALIVEKPTPRSFGSNVGSGSTIKVVGDMRFDPEKMCWVALGEEKAVDWGDEWDEDDDRGGTIRAKKLVVIGTASMGRSTSTTDTQISMASRISYGSSRFASVSNVSDITEEVGESQYGRHGQPGLVSEELRKECMRAERRHRRELQRWFGSKKSEDEDRREQREWERLMLIRREALRR